MTSLHGAEFTEEEARAYNERARTAAQGATREECRQYLLDGGELQPAFVETLPDETLKRIAALGGDDFIRFVSEHRQAPSGLQVDREYQST